MSQANKVTFPPPSEKILRQAISKRVYINMDWQSLIYAVSRGVMAFAARSSTNSLASPDNLARWKKIVHAKCPLCSVSPCTLGHLLSNCQQALSRYEWRHNNVVKYLHSLASSQGMEAYTELEGCRVNVFFWTLILKLYF